MNYWFDENVPPPLVMAIAALHARDYPDDRVLSARDTSEQGRSDAEWIATLMRGGEQWTVLTRDAMRKERRLAQSSGFTWFIFARGWANMDYWNMSWKLVRAWPGLVETGRRSPGQIFTVTVNGKSNATR